MNRLRYFSRETFISLRRNMMMTVSGIITIAVTATMIGGMLLFIWGNDRAAAKARGDVELEIFMAVKATPNQVADVRAELDSMKQRGLVTSYQFLDHDAALREYKKLFGSSTFAGIKGSDLNESFRPRVADQKDLDSIAARFETFPGVVQVNTPAKFVHAYFRKVDQARNFIVIGAIALTVASAFLVVTTVRLATYARRREIEVMKLVGASNLFVRIPFLTEGMVQGLIGGGIAFGLIWVTRGLLHSLAGSTKSSISVAAYLVLSGFRNTNADLWHAGLIVVIGAAFVGFVSALVGVRRFLEV